MLNPVRAKIVATVEKWPWSSYRASAGESVCPKCLAAEKVMSLFSGRRSSYRRFVFEGIARDSIWEHLNGQIYLGEEEFLGRVQNIVDRSAARGITKAQRKPLTPRVDEIINTVGSAYGISASEVLDRNYVEGYWLVSPFDAPGRQSSIGRYGSTCGSFPCADFTDPDENEHGKTSKKMDAVL